MKRIIALFLVILTCFSFAACGGGSESEEDSFNPREAFESKVRSEVSVYCLLTYSEVKLATTSLTDIDVDGDVYTGKGKVTVRDNYGDTYVGKVTAEYRYNEDTQSFTKINLDIETPKKQ